MPQEGADLTHDIERVDVSMLSQTQRDMLWMRLRGDDATYVFDGHDVTVPATRASLLTDALAWVNTEVRSPPPGYYPPHHPFQRALDGGEVVAPRWRRVAATCIDSALLGTLSAIAARHRLPGWALLISSALYTIGMTGRWGRTVGKVAVEIRVADASRRTRVTWRQSAVRWAAVGWIGIAGGWVRGGGAVFLSAAQLAIYAPTLWDSHGRGLHDRLARTVVIVDPPRERRRRPISQGAAMLER